MRRVLALLAAAAALASPLSARDSTATLRAAQAEAVRTGHPFVVEVTRAHANRDGTTTVTLKLWASTRNSNAFVSVPVHDAGWACRRPDGTMHPARFLIPNRGDDGFHIGFQDPVTLSVITRCGAGTGTVALNVAFRIASYSNRYGGQTERFMLPAVTVS